MRIIYNIEECLTDYRKLHSILTTEELMEIGDSWNIKPKKQLRIKEVIKGDIIKRMYKQIA